MTHVHGVGHPGPADAATPPDTPPYRLVATLGVAGALAGLLVALVYQVTLPPIERHRAQVMQVAIAEVLQHPTRWDTLYLEEGALTQHPRGSRASLERVFVGYNAAGRSIGAAISAAEPGFSEIISLMFGYDLTSGQLLGLKLLEQKETPGLGDKIERDSAFVRQFVGAKAPVKATKKKSVSNPSEIDAISGATISSRAVTRIINNAVARWDPLLRAWKPAGGST